MIFANFGKGDRCRLPDFLLVGAARAGTTSIFSYLKLNSDIFLPDFKEPMFFYYYDNERAQLEKGSEIYIKNLEDYLSLFPRRQIDKALLWGEASTVYLHRHKETINNIRKVYGDTSRSIKILISIRHPVDRAVSMYNFQRMRGRENAGFSDAIKEDIIFDRLNRKLWGSGFDYVGGSMYAEAIEAYTGAFDNVKIVTFDELKTVPEALMKEIFSFLGVDFIDSDLYGTVINPSGTKKKSVLATVLKHCNNNQNLKKILKNILPSKSRIGVRAWVEKQTIQKQTALEVMSHCILGVFSKDILKTAKIVGEVESTERAQIVGSWNKAHKRLES